MQFTLERVTNELNLSEVYSPYYIPIDDKNGMIYGISFIKIDTKENKRRIIDRIDGHCTGNIQLSTEVIDKEE